LGAAVATAWGADDDIAAPVGNGLLSGLFHEKPRSQAQAEKQISNQKLQKASSVESVAAEQQRHMNALMRRMEVCDRLRMIANQTGNEALMTQANELEERANAIYRLQTSRLPLPAQAPLSVLAADRENPSRDPQGAQGMANSPLPAGSGSDDFKRVSIDSPPRMGGNPDQREQAILNGTSMGGQK
ncbi:MAG: hypothetical protein ACRELF_16510, partial [Gemmataceae bacterium]